MLNRFFAVVMITLVFGVPALAVQPNLEPGQWQYETTTVFEGDLPIPDQTETTTDCLTQEKLDDRDLLQDFGEACEVVEQEIRADGMDFAVRCSVDEHQTNMTGQMRFMGDRADGSINADVETPMGLMSMNMNVTGTRVGDC